MSRQVFRLLILVFLFFGSLAHAQTRPTHCVDLALETGLDYCYRIYRRQSYADCVKGVSASYENTLVNESTDFGVICRPYLMSACDSGRKVFIGYLNRYCKEK